jgi:GNAT superfamily N-acetyltransferase
MTYLRPATRGDLEELVEIERQAGRAFAAVGMPEIAADDPGSPEELAPFVVRGHAWVMADDGDRPVAYLIADVVDDRLHIEQVSVHPSHARQGLGAALIEHVAHAGRDLSLTTFRDVPWNAPYYARLGFRVLEPADHGPELAELVRHEAEAIPGDAPRVAMVRP